MKPFSVINAKKQRKTIEQERLESSSTPVLLPGKSYGWRSLVGCSPWGRKESDKTEATEQPHSQYIQTVGCKIGSRMYFTTRGIIRNNCKWNVGVPSLSCVQPFATLWTVAHQASLSMEFSRQEYWSGVSFPSPEDLPDPGIKPRSPALQADALPSEPPGKHQESTPFRGPLTI